MKLFLFIFLSAAVAALGFVHKPGYKTNMMKFAKQGKEIEEDIKQSTEKPSFMSGMVQLMTMGAGAPSLGEFQEFDEDGKAIFKLEANNFVDSENNPIQLKAKFFESGWSEGSSDAIQPPGFFENLMSGGKKMAAWDEENRKNS